MNEIPEEKETHMSMADSLERSNTRLSDISYKRIDTLKS